LKWEAERLKLVRDLGRVLVKMNALQFGTFTLTSGKLSPYYIDLRVVPSFPDVFRMAVTAYKDALVNHVGLGEVDAVGGVPTSGLTYATVVAYELGKPLIYVRERGKTHGTLRRVEGALKPGCRVLLIDDLVTTGTSLVNAAEAVRSEGGVVDNALVLIDRMEGGRERLESEGVRLNCLTTIEELAGLLYDMDIIDVEQIKAIRSQIKKGEE